MLDRDQDVDDFEPRLARPEVDRGQLGEKIELEGRAFEQHARKEAGTDWPGLWEYADPQNPKEPRIFAFLEPVDALLADAQRRVKEGARPPLDLTALAKRPQGARIRALVENLDEVSERQMGQPGEVILQSDPIVAALREEVGAR